MSNLFLVPSQLDLGFLRFVSAIGTQGAISQETQRIYFVKSYKVDVSSNGEDWITLKEGSKQKVREFTFLDYFIVTKFIQTITAICIIIYNYIYNFYSLYLFLWLSDQHRITMSKVAWNIPSWYSSQLWTVGYNCGIQLQLWIVEF